MRNGFLVLLLGSMSALAQVVITEVNSTQTAYASYVEIKNAGGADVDLSGFTITYGNNGSETVVDEPLNADGYSDGLVLSPGEFFLVLRSQSTFQSEYSGVNLNSGSDDGDNSSIEFMMHGNIYLNGGADYLVLKGPGGSIADRFGGASQSWSDNHAFERHHYPNSGTVIDNDWVDLGSNVAGTPGRSNDHSLPVELSLFRARQCQQGIELTWTTETQVDNYGFYLLRSESREGPYQRSSPFIPGHGTQSSAHHYKFLDDRIETGSSYYYKLEQLDNNGEQTFYGPVFIQTSQDENGSVSPSSSRLNGSYPNPFNPKTRIYYAVAGKTGQRVRISIYNQRGQRVKNIVDATTAAGEYWITWSGDNQQGLPVATGIYFCRLLTSGGTISTLKLLKLP
ncbi:T9SS type A sorting domain-containing protein [candidate division KSB1 bacterium]|nr:T9SS type A sorting domain-containing protein [candidate division KSB1 bacterium]